MADISGFTGGSAAPDLIPDKTWVEAMIVQSDVKDTAANDGGKYLKLEFDIVSGPYKNRKLWENLNLVNKNPTCVSIAKNKLAKIKAAVGQSNATDSVQLHGLPMMVKVGVKDGQGGEDQNCVQDFKPREQVGPKMAQAVSQLQPAAPTLAQAAPAPWQRS